MINACGFAQVVCVDPHSDVMPALIDRLKVIPVENVVEYVLSKVPVSYAGFIAPDVGASKKVWRVAHHLGRPMYQASKHRDMKTGRLSAFNCEELPPNGRLLMVDDICDGGGTFMGEATYMKDRFGIGPDRLDLYVTHGVFSGDKVEDLHTFFGKVLTTNSYPGAATARYNDEFNKVLSVTDIHSLMMEALIT